MIVRSVAIGVMVILCCARPAAGQAPADGQLRGTVSDASGAVIAGASVSVSSSHLIGGAKVVATAADGQWRIAALPSGSYTISVTAPRFAARIHEAVNL